MIKYIQIQSIKKTKREDDQIALFLATLYEVAKDMDIKVKPFTLPK